MSLTNLKQHRETIQGQIEYLDTIEVCVNFLMGKVKEHQATLYFDFSVEDGIDLCSSYYIVFPKAGVFAEAKGIIQSWFEDLGLEIPEDICDETLEEEFNTKIGFWFDETGLANKLSTNEYIYTPR